MTGVFDELPTETGILEAAEFAAPVPEASPREKLDALKNLVQLPSDLNVVKLTALARDIAQDLRPVADILITHGLTQQQYEYLEQSNDLYRRILADQAELWQGIKGTRERVRAQAAAALEAQLPHIAARMGNAAEKLSEVVEAGKLLAKIADVDAPSGGSTAGGERYSITIDLGADTRVVVGVAGNPVPGADEAQLKTVSPVGGGSSSAGALPALAEGPGDDPPV